MTRYKHIAVGEDGWTDWVQPRHVKYKLMCCDCGLVHEMQFRAVRNDEDKATVNVDRQTKALVVFRVRRDERATAASRRKKTPVAKIDRRAKKIVAPIMARNFDAELKRRKK